MTDPIIRRDIIQGEAPWKLAKAGKFSSSNAAVIMGGLTTDGLEKYIKKLAWERFTGTAAPDGFKSDAMQRGNDMEPESLDWYAFEKGHTLEAVGLVEHATIPNVCWSPDGLVIGKPWAVECKNPGYAAWMDTKRTGLVPSEYRWQCRWGIWVGGLDGMDYVSYRPETSGIVIACHVTESEKDQMAERVTLLEPRIAAWIEIIGNKA